MTFPKEDLDKRFQNQPWYVKLWRSRWYVMIPIWTLKWVGKKWSDGEVLTFREAYSLAIGTAQGRMQWWFTMDECEEYWNL